MLDLHRQLFSEDISRFSRKSVKVRFVTSVLFPSGYLCHLVITFANSLIQIMADRMSLLSGSKQFDTLIFEKLTTTTKACKKIPSMQRVICWDVFCRYNESHFLILQLPGGIFWVTFHVFCCRLLIFFKIYFFRKFFQEHYQIVKQFGCRSGPMLCRS